MDIKYEDDIEEEDYDSDGDTESVDPSEMVSIQITQDYFRNRDYEKITRKVLYDIISMAYKLLLEKVIIDNILI